VVGEHSWHFLFFFAVFFDVMLNPCFFEVYFGIPYIYVMSLNSLLTAPDVFIKHMDVFLTLVCPFIGGS
jgi:hypothetical protein